MTARNGTAAGLRGEDPIIKAHPPAMKMMKRRSSRRRKWDFERYEGEGMGFANKVR
jgi:hypothetical protein